MPPATFCSLVPDVIDFDDANTLPIFSSFQLIITRFQFVISFNLIFFRIFFYGYIQKLHRAHAVGMGSTGFTLTTVGKYNLYCIDVFREVLDGGTKSH